MSRYAYHRRFHSDFLLGVRDLTPAQRGIYNTLCDLMYERRGPLLDDEFSLAGQNKCSPRVFRRIRNELHAAGKILVASGFISNPRVMQELAAAGQIDSGPSIEAGADLAARQERAAERRAKTAERVRRHRARKQRYNSEVTPVDPKHGEALHASSTCPDVTHTVMPLQSERNAENDRQSGLFEPQHCNAASDTISRVEESLRLESVAAGAREEAPSGGRATPLAAEGQRRRAPYRKPKGKRLPSAEAMAALNAGPTADQLRDQARERAAKLNGSRGGADA